MQFDHVIRVDADGSVTEPTGVYAPEIHVSADDDGQILDSDETEMREYVERQGWTLLTGYTGQHGYHGPIMHPSEFIGGTLARDILAAPGLYVALVVDTLDDDEPAGWAVAYRAHDGRTP